MDQLKLKIPSQKFFDEAKLEFLETDSYEIRMQHTLHTIAQWESKWKKPFFGTEHSNEELFDYFKIMTIGERPDDFIYENLPQESLQQIGDFLGDSHTATWFVETKRKRIKNEQTITSELIYYWMIAYSVNISFEHWNIMRLMTLLRTCAEEQAEPEQVSSDQQAQNYRDLNAQRRAKLNSKG